MKRVPRLWLRYFQAALLVLDAVVIGLYGYQTTTGTELAFITGAGADRGAVSVPSAAIAGLAALHAVYVFTILWWFERKHAWSAHAPAILLSGALIVLLTNINGPLPDVYQIVLIVFIFFAAMAGPVIPALVFVFAFFLLILGSLRANTMLIDPNESVIEMLQVGLWALAAGVGWLIFSKRYVGHPDNHSVESLTGIIKQERNTVNIILESITDGVMIIGPSGTVEVLNTSIANMLGWPKNEAVKLQYNALLQHPDGEKDPKTAKPSNQPSEPLAVEQTMKSGEPSRAVSLIKTREGRQVYLDIAASPIYQNPVGKRTNSEKMAGVIAVVRDVDKQKREEQQRSEFISTASHEMRTPVAAIEGYLALAMNDKVSTIDAKARSYLEKAHESTQHLGKLFQDLLTSTKAEDGRLSNHPVVVEMGQYLEQLVESLRFAAEKKGLLLEFAIGAATPQDKSSIMNGKVIKPLYYVHADPDRIREVITNLFDNAVKYTPEGKISIGLTGNNDIVQFYIRDTGPGIPAADLPHLFQKFYRVDNSATRTIGGTGLGLFICRKIIELYKGRIWAESDLGKGSTFYINLPRLTTQKANELQKTEATQAANTSVLDKA